MMRARVLLFGPPATIAGSDAVTVDLGRDRTCRAVKEALAANAPSLAPILAAARIAINHEFVPPEREVREGDEIALIAMVSGG